ncbi:MAG: FG-GAP repeat protein [Elusimicrobia bacterium]|nr:FG-GAP repeat protein [Elusimicrobiota bacterium]
MIIKRFVIFCSLFPLAIAVVRGKDYFLSNGHQDATILIDEYQDSLWPYARNMAVGDFNGDGKDDFAVRPVFNTEQGVQIIFGRSFEATSNLTDNVSVRVSLASGMGGAFPIVMGDINADSQDDVMVSDDSLGTIYVLQGSSSPAPSMDALSASLKFIGSPNLTGRSMVVGDFNGDGNDDVATGYQRSDSRKAVGIVFGASLLDSTLSLATSTGVASVVLKESSWEILGLYKGRLSRPEADDLIAWVRTPASDQFLVIGTSTWSSVWDLNVHSPTAVAFYSTTDIKFDGSVSPLVDDLNGDGLADVAFNVAYYSFDPPTYAQYLLDGSKILSLARWDLNQSANPWVPPQWVTYAGYGNLGFLSIHSLDFDGDGHKDLLALRERLLSLDLYLDSERPAINSPVGFFYAAPFLRAFWTKNVNTLLLPGDFNGDGFEDILIHSDIEQRAHLTGPPFSMFSLFYGFRPLKNPTVVLRPRAMASSRVDLELGVEGDPTEMRLSGDITDPIKDQWIPYQTRYTVTMSPDDGQKEVRATFRNGFRRESETVTGALARAVTQTRTAVVTNRMAAGRTGVVDCHLAEASHVRAEVFTLSGDPIRLLHDASHGPGIVPIEWDGTGSDGRRLAPGVYVFVIDINDKRETHRVLLK